MGLFEQALGLHQRAQGLGGELAGLGLRQRIGFCGGDDAVDQTDLQSGLGHKGFTHQQGLGRTVVAHEARREQAGGRLRAQTEVDEGHGESRVVPCVNQVAMEQHGGADADRGAADGGEQGLGELRQFGDETLNRGIACAGHRRAAQKITQIVSCAEHGDVPLDHDDTGDSVRGRASQGIRHGGVHGLGKGIFLLDTVQGQGQNAVGVVDQDVWHGEVFSEKMRDLSKPG